MLDFSKLQVNDCLSEHSFYKVVSKDADNVILQNDFGEGLQVSRKLAEQSLTSASQVDKTENVNKTQAAEIFLANPGTVMTVVFNKQVKEADVLKEILEAHQNSAPKDIEKAFKATIKKAIQGEERTIIGRHNGSTDEFGRTHFLDMMIDKEPSKSYDARQRLVDSRTIKSIVVKGVKYTVK